MKDNDHYLFYCDNINVKSGNIITLDSTETRHAVSVLRTKAGQRIQITDGNGAIYECECSGVAKQSLSCEMIGQTIVPRILPELTLLIGLPDKERFETILEYAAALGVSRVVPLVMDHCRKPWWGSWEKSRDRFRAKMIVSMKQCLYPYVPRLDAPTTLREIIDTCDKPLIVADQRGKKIEDADMARHARLTCLTGPPGGLSANEIKLLGSFEAATVKIAPTRLRTELAATVLCSRVIAACQ